jgi:hypothetical protein
MPTATTFGCGPRRKVLLRRLSAGEAVADPADWPHIIEEIEHGSATRSPG